MSRNVNPEWYYRWDQEPESDDEYDEAERALDDDADAYFDRYND